MSTRRNSLGNRSASISRQQQSRTYVNGSHIDSTTKNDAISNILPDLIKSIRNLLPKEIPFNMHVRNVEYIENKCERLTGTLYMTTFRLVFAPDQEIEDNDFIFSGNKYIGTYDIPLTSIHNINVAPVDSRSGFKSFLNESQIQSETRTFTITTRDFRVITFTKCSVTQSNTGTKHSHAPTTNMETYIEALRLNSRFQSKNQLYPYLALDENSKDRPSHDNILTTIMNSRSIDDITADFSMSNDERIKSYMISNHWKDELYEANEQRWIVDRKKFNKQYIAQEEGPFVRLVNSNDDDNCKDLIWHWTHTSEVRNDHQNKRQIQPQKFMLITVPNIGEIATIEPPETPISAPTVSSSSSFRFFNIKKMKLPKALRSHTTDGPKLICTNESKTTTSSLTAKSEMASDVGLRRATTDANLVPSPHYIHDQPFQRYNLAKFPCNLKRLQTSYEKLIDICVVTSDDNDDDKWLTKLNSCKWLKYVSKTLHGAASLAKLLDFKNIELAGSDTDNNCLMSSLVQILLRPKCRTIKGFCELIVREWIIRGHKFRERFGQVSHDVNRYPVQESPVFLLFLDCIHQLIIQNPFSFEFTDYFLIEIYHDICYCYHHTFAFNNITERLQAISNCPKTLLVLSSFDFSLYLSPNAYRLLKNDTSIFNSQISSSSSSHQQNKSRIESAIYDSESTPVQRYNRTNSYSERPKSTSFSYDISITNGTLLANAEHYDYDTIESPQIFIDDLHVDWRVVNLVLWSKCYCRYDQTYMPTSYEQDLSSEINHLKEKIETIRSISKRPMAFDTFHYTDHANSWHPQALDTRI
ncbi:unnamed protein product [Adineta steineri]|uniref:Myotubularin phosphatase domain-containing protein n=1 Tax=Adineta steineri TaxID=433720 RepID=A0A818KZ93_9BILA|nr:unnamed protein product [Adineta steineri]